MTTEPKTTDTPTTEPTTATWAAREAGNGRYANVNGIHLYYEVHGPRSGAATGRPMVLLHGGLGSGEMFGPVLPTLSADREVILPDLQGHGRTADVDRALSIQAMAEDVAALIEQLGLDHPDVVGYSLGGGVALFVAAKHPELVHRAVITSANVTRSAIPAEMLAQQEQVTAAAAEFLKGTPMYELYQRVAPRPEDFPRLLEKIGQSMAKDFDYSDVVRSLAVPTLIACADADMAPPSHYVEVFKLLDGGLRDGGWMGEGRPKGGHALAVIPNATHYNVFASPVWAAATLAFLAEGSPAQ